MKGTNTEPTLPDGNADQDDELELVSKSQLKRDSKALQDLGKRLCRLNTDQLSRIPIETPLQDAITLAHKLVNKRSALKRHYQYIGKLLRSIDSDPILQAVQDIEAAQSNSALAFKRLEQWRERILQEGDSAIQDYCAQHSAADRQQLRQIARNHKNAKDEGKKTRLARQLFKALRDSS